MCVIITTTHYHQIPLEQPVHFFLFLADQKFIDLPLIVAKIGLYVQRKKAKKKHCIVHCRLPLVSFDSILFFFFFSITILTIIIIIRLFVIVLLTFENFFFQKKKSFSKIFVRKFFNQKNSPNLHLKNNIGSFWLACLPVVFFNSSNIFFHFFLSFTIRSSRKNSRSSSTNINHHHHHQSSSFFSNSTK